MEIASLLLGQLADVQISNSSSKSNQGFDSFLSSAKSNIADNQSIKDAQTTNNFDRGNNYNSDNTSKSENVSKVKESTYEESKNVTSSESKKANTTSDENTSEENTIEKDKKSGKIIIFDPNLLSQISEILGINSNEIMAKLSEIEMSISMLENTENVVTFLTEVLELETPIELLSKDNIKESIVDIKEIASSVDYNDFMNTFEEVKETIKNSNLESAKVVTLDEIELNVEELLFELNGNVSEVKTFKLEENLSLEESLTLGENFNSEESLILGGNFNSEESLILGGNLNSEESLTLGKSLNSEEDATLNYESIESPIIQPTQSNYLANDSNFAQNSNNNFEGNNENLNIEVFNISQLTDDAKIFNATLPATQSLRNINTTEVIAQIMDKIKTAVSPDMTEVKILLRPEHLGEVSLKIITQNGIITAQFTAESQKVKEVIESNFNQLKDMLNEQGIEVGALEVNVSDRNEESFNHFQNMQQNMQEKSSERINGIIEKSFEENENQIKENEEIKIDSQVDYII